MCRNIRRLYNIEPQVTDDEVHAAAVQFVRKISGSTTPSHANEAAFERAIESIKAASIELIGSLTTHAPPRDRAADSARARARSAERFAR